MTCKLGIFEHAIEHPHTFMTTKDKGKDSGKQVIQSWAETQLVMMSQVTACHDC